MTPEFLRLSFLPGLPQKPATLSTVAVHPRPTQTSEAQTSPLTRSMKVARGQESPLTGSMRLLDTLIGQFVERNANNIEYYAILSHAWDNEKGEQTFKQLRKIQKRYSTVLSTP